MHFRNGELRGSFSVPTAVAYDCLLFSAYVYYDSSLQRRILNHCGTARVTRGQRAATFLWDDGTPALGRLTFDLDIGPQEGAPPYPLSVAAASTARELVARSTHWFDAKHGGEAPISRDLAAVHVPTLPSIFPQLPGFEFAALAPVSDDRGRPQESEVLFERMLRIAARRRAGACRSRRAGTRGPRRPTWWRRRWRRCPTVSCTTRTPKWTPTRAGRWRTRRFTATRAPSRTATAKTWRTK
jgi:hypothetical protein